MNKRQRLTTPMELAAPVQFHTSDQKWQRVNASGRFDNDPLLGSFAPVSHMRCHSDGTVDVISLDQDENGYIDLGGIGGTDFAAGRM